MNDLSRYFPFDVRPLHRECLESYTRRLLTANFITPTHMRLLTNLVTDATATRERETAWLEVLALKTKRTKLHLDPHPSKFVTHADGSSCEFCAELLPETRQMCALCAGGGDVQQNSHFDDLVCMRHSRWVGLTTPADGQHPVGSEHLHAARTFRKLRRQGRLDVRLFTLLQNSISALLSTNGQAVPESAAFPLVVAAAAAVTERGFARSFFDPDTRFVDAHRMLSDTLDAAIGRESGVTARALWLYARPTAWAVRHAALTGRPFEPAWVHDFYIDPKIVGSVTTHRQDLEPFENYLDVTGDDVVSAAQFGLGFSNERRLPPPTAKGAVRQVLAICAAGHQFPVDRERPFAPRPTKAPKCPSCHGHIVLAGYNDLETLWPRIAEEFDLELNAPVRPSQVAPGSRTRYFWRCPVGHRYPATASNRTAARSTCPVCMNRLIQAGVNDIATTHPALVTEMHPSWLLHVNPTKHGAGSLTSVGWVCQNGHEFVMRICDRVASKGCQECAGNRRHPSATRLPESHPVLAGEWHPSLNTESEPGDFSHGSHFVAHWVCPVGHVYKQRIDRRADGYGCSVCSRRTLVPGVNDLQTAHPELAREFHSYMNGPKNPSKLFPGTALFWWKCTAHGHEYRQSVPHRVKSQGCPECPLEERVLTH